MLRARRLGMDVPIALGLTVTYLYSLLGRQVYFDTVATFVFVLLIGRVLEQDEVFSARLPDILVDDFAAAMPVYRLLATLPAG